MFRCILLVTCSRYLSSEQDSSLFPKTRPIYSDCYKEMLRSYDKTHGGLTFVGSFETFNWEHNENGSKKILYDDFGNIKLKFKNEDEKKGFFLKNWAAFYCLLISRELFELGNIIYYEANKNYVSSILYEKYCNVVKFFNFFDLEENYQKNNYKKALAFHQYVDEKAFRLKDEKYIVFKREYIVQIANKGQSHNERAIRELIEQADESMEKIFTKLEDCIKLNKIVLEILKR
ncbi:uncharacterized protein VNE69_09024 [Vairimorpha necatrix]|uniref:Uncharacterized protein n=1 Tax=Vairimorpha necatrix TaxID=6039 RepID=A0AAX4JEN4_9MICR